MTISIRKKRIVSLFAVLVIFACALPCYVNAYDKLSDKYIIEDNGRILESKSYFQYIQDVNEKQTDKVNSDNEIIVDLNTISGVGYDIELIEATSVIWEDDTCEYIEFEFTAQHEGLYHLEIDYMALSGTVEAPRRGIKIDDATLYRELNNVAFNRIWVDAGKPELNLVGDMIPPKQKEIFERQNVLICDTLGRYDTPLRMYIEKGEHVLRFEYVAEPMKIYGIKFVPVKEYKTYNQVLKGYIDSDYINADETIKINAEEPYRKSESSIRLQFSGEPKVDPPSQGNYVLNTIGGASWNKGNQSITYQFEITEPGLYKIGLRTYTKYSQGLAVYRQIKIDNEVPFEEFLSYKFDYDDWKNTVLEQDNKTPYLIYFDEGTHHIELSVCMSAYATVLYNFEGILNDIAATTQQILRVTGITPDPNFDYQLDKKIPGLMEGLENISKGFGNQIETLKTDTQKNSESVNSLAQIKLIVDNMIKKPFNIAKGLNSLIDSQTTLSNWINTFNDSPMALDYIEIASPDADLERGRAGFFEMLAAAFRSFLQSFVKDYDNIAGITAGTADKKLNVWLSRGKEWGEILKWISDDDFTKNNDTLVNFNILPPGQLGIGGIMLMAIASGTEPDIVLGVDAVTPVEYGIRGAVADLAQMPDYNEISKRFADGTKIPYEFDGRVFALPETIDFSLLYYRTDILNELNIKIPSTWEELYQRVLPILKHNGMDFWYDGGLAPFLFQNGGDFYTQDGKESTLNSPESIAAFKWFAELYMIYGVPYEADFYTRFRTGQMPIGISSFGLYPMLSSAAPELQGKWDVTLIPGTVGKEGVVDHSGNIGSTSMMIFNTSKNIDAAYKFLEWYSRAGTQMQYASDIVSYIGPEAKWFTANIEAFNKMPWETGVKKVLMEQLQWGRAMRNVVGGYITPRHIENARVRTVMQDVNYRTSIEKASMDINSELNIKNKEFENRAAKD